MGSDGVDNGEQVAAVLSAREQRQERRQRIRERRERRRRKTAGIAVSPLPASPPDNAGVPLPASLTPPTQDKAKCSLSTPFVDRHNNPLYLHDLHQDATAFLVLAGPSLASLDLSLLKQRGIWTIGVNQSPSVVHTNAWTFVDTPRKFHSGIWLDPTVLKIIPEKQFNRALMWKVGDEQGERAVAVSGTPGNTPGKPRFVTLTREMAGLRGSNEPPTTKRGGNRSGKPQLLCKELPGVIGYKRNAFFDAEKWLDEDTVNWGNSRRSFKKNGIPHTLNVMFAVTKICYALGFRRLYLVGCDFYMSESQPYAFDQGKDEGGCNSNNNAYRNLNQMFGLLRPRFEAKGFEVFNCNPASGFKVFPFRGFSDAIADARKRMPREPWNVSGWYDATPE